MKGSWMNPAAAVRLGSALLLLTVAGQAWASPAIFGKVTGPSGTDLTTVKVVATNDKFQVLSPANGVAADGTYSIVAPPNGTYTVAVVAAGLAAPKVTNLVISNANPTGTANFTLTTPQPFCIVKSPNPIPLTDGIDSASFQDAPEIDLKSGENVVVGDATMWGGPTTVSGRFKVKFSTAAIHLAGDVTYKAPDVNNQTDGSIWNGNAIEVDIQSDKYDPTRTAYDNDHNWQFGLSLDTTPDWWLWGGIQAHPSIGGKDEAVTSHVMIQEKPTKDGETFRVDIPWAILLDSSGKAITAPADNALGAFDIALDASDPTADRTTADRSTGFQLTWSGSPNTYKDPSQDVPVQFCPQAPASLGLTGGTGDVTAPGSTTPSSTTPASGGTSTTPKP